MTMWLDRLALSGARQAIDQIDDRMVLLFAHRQRLAALAGRIKAGAGWVRLMPHASTPSWSGRSAERNAAGWIPTAPRN